MNIRKGVSIALAILVIGVLAAQFLPIVIDGFNNMEEQTFSQSEDENVTIAADLIATPTDISETDSEATVELTDEKDGTTESKTVGLDETVTYNMPDGDVDVTLDSIENSTDGTFTYVVPEDYNWSGASSSLWGLFGLFFILIFVIFGVKMAQDKGKL